MNAVILSAGLLGGNADLDARAALALAMASPPKVASVCPCGPGCACGPACDCPEVAPVRLPAIKRLADTGRLLTADAAGISYSRNLYSMSPDGYATADYKTRWEVRGPGNISSSGNFHLFQAALGNEHRMYIEKIEVVFRPDTYGVADYIRLIRTEPATVKAVTPARPALTLTSSTTYPQHMSPMPAFRPYQPAPMYFGGFGGCVGGA